MTVTSLPRYMDGDLESQVGQMGFLTGTGLSWGGKRGPLPSSWFWECGRFTGLTLPLGNSFCETWASGLTSLFHVCDLELVMLKRWGR